jgi:hypothetical protein
MPVAKQPPGDACRNSDETNVRSIAEKVDDPAWKPDGVEAVRQANPKYAVSQ